MHGYDARISRTCGRVSVVEMVILHAAISMVENTVSPRRSARLSFALHLIAWPHFRPHARGWSWSPPPWPVIMYRSWLGFGIGFRLALQSMRTWIHVAIREKGSSVGIWDWRNWRDRARYVWLHCMICGQDMTRIITPGMPVPMSMPMPMPTV